MPSQLHLPIAPQAVPKPRDLDPQTLMHCRNWREAVREGVARSHYVGSLTDLARELHMDPGTLGHILNKKAERLRYFDADRFREVEQILGNRCISQFFELESKGLLIRDREMSIEEKAAAFDQMRAAI